MEECNASVLAIGVSVVLECRMHLRMEPKAEALYANIVVA